MNSQILRRPIAVSMCLIALTVMGILALRHIPVSLMPDIDVPQITVQVSMPGYSAQEVEQNVVSPLRGRLMQVAGVTDIRSESRMDAGSVHMSFDPGSNVDLLFIEVNEKVDRAMNQMPKGMDRPKVMKASAMDIPAFFLDIAPLQTSSVGNGDCPPLVGPQPHSVAVVNTPVAPQGGRLTSQSFADLSKFVRNVIVKRIEQLPQVAMIDMSGTVGSEIECIPDYDMLRSLGMNVTDLENAIKRNNITLEALSVVDGLYRYNIHFDSQLLTRQDIEDIYINHDGRLIQMKDVCSIREKTAARNGLVRHNGEEAVTLAIIKQNDARMEDLQQSMDVLLEDMREEYTDVRFDLTRDQTRLLSYTISNLKGNLYMGALMACLVLFLFMRRWRLSLLVVLCIPASLVITLLCFYLLGISLNIISLSGLILGVGMMVDNAIIVIDNIDAPKTLQNPPLKGGLATRSSHTSKSPFKGDLEGLENRVANRVKEVFAPMLSSVLTTCSVFIPLIFLSGTAGALFYDLAMGVTTALFASLLVATVALPVYYVVLHKRGQTLSPALPLYGEGADYLKPPHRGGGWRGSFLYECVLRWTLRHVRTCILVVLCSIPVGVILLLNIEKERMPKVAQEDTLITIDWNSNISAEENDRRTGELLAQLERHAETSTSMIGAQEFMLAHTKDITSSESVVYFKARSADELTEVKELATNFLSKHYPQASVEYEEPGNLYDLIFSTDEADLEIHLQTDEGRRPEVNAARAFRDTLLAHFGNLEISPVMTETNIRYIADAEQMAMYKVGYDVLYRRLKELVSRSCIFNINDGAQSVPVIVSADGEQTIHLLEGSVTNSEGTEIPISYLVRESKGEDYKRLQAGNGGEYYALSINAKDREVEKVMDFVNEYVRKPGSKYSASFSGGYFSSRKLIGELSVVLAVALALLFFILAAQFESLIQPFIILAEMVIDVFFVVVGLWLMGESLNLMSMTGIVVMSGIIINDSILKIDTINRIRRNRNSQTPSSSPLKGATGVFTEATKCGLGPTKESEFPFATEKDLGGSGGSSFSLLRAIIEAGHRRLRPIVMTSLTTILALLPFLSHDSMGSAIQYPLSLTLVIGMTVGTIVSLFFVPMLYYIIYRKR